MWEYISKIGNAFRKYWKEGITLVAVPVLLCGCTALAEGFWEGYDEHESHRARSAPKKVAQDYDPVAEELRNLRSEMALQRSQDELRRAVEESKRQADIETMKTDHYLRTQKMLSDKRMAERRLQKKRVWVPGQKRHKIGEGDVWHPGHWEYK